VSVIKVNTTINGPKVSRPGELTGAKPVLRSAAVARAGGQAKIWIDLDNTPHVPFFKPIIRELERRGWRPVVTARDAFQVCDLAAEMGLSCRPIGRHYGKNRLMKVWGLGWRTLQLLPFFLQQRPVLALSHGSRSQILLGNLLRVPTVMVMDYEHAETPWLLRPRWEIVPEVLRPVSLHCRNRERIRFYQGIKEDVYAGDLNPDPRLLESLGVADARVLATARPPATEAHYHNPESEVLFEAFMNRAVATPGVKVVLLPRNKNQESQARARFPGWFEGGRTVVPQGAVDGLNLLWHSDLVVSGGGTMNREAAALGVPVYSIFRGKLGAVDRHLQSEGRLVLVDSVEAVQRTIRLESRPKAGTPQSRPRRALQDILAHVEQILQLEQAG